MTQKQNIAVVLVSCTMAQSPDCRCSAGLNKDAAEHPQRRLSNHSILCGLGIAKGRVQEDETQVSLATIRLQQDNSWSINVLDSRCAHMRCVGRCNSCMGMMSLSMCSGDLRGHAEFSNRTSTSWAVIIEFHWLKFTLRYPA